MRLMATFSFLVWQYAAWTTAVAPLPEISRGNTACVKSITSPREQGSLPLVKEIGQYDSLVEPTALSTVQTHAVHTSSMNEDTLL